MKAVTGSSNTKLIKLVLCTLIEFCQKSTTYDANFVKRQLISYKVVRVGMVWISCYVNIYRLLLTLSATNIRITLDDICDWNSATGFSRTPMRFHASRSMLNQNLILNPVYYIYQTLYPIYHYFYWEPCFSYPPLWIVKLRISFGSGCAHLR